MVQPPKPRCGPLALSEVLGEVMDPLGARALRRDWDPVSSSLLLAWNMGCSATWPMDCWPKGDANRHSCRWGQGGKAQRRFYVGGAISNAWL